ncbi:MAG: alpha-xylosidase [Lachnospiraceae bacterium]|nr:alpha-xylosidase [Lachnospiraceae bacterium]
MKFTEGYWLRSEKVTPFYASDVHYVDRIENGFRMLCPTRKIEGRGDVLNLPTITVEFTSAGPDMIAVRSFHYEAYESGEARYPLNIDPSDVSVTISDDEIVMVNGKLSVKVDRKDFSYSFIADGEVLTTCGFRNLAYYQYGREESTMLPADNYFTERCKRYMVTELSLAPGECVYGLGERFTPFVKNGQSINTWNEDGGTSSDIAYKSIPFYMTNKGYGVFVDYTGNASFEVASDKVEYVGISVPEEEMRYVFIYGPSPKDVVKNYTSLTGRPGLPPAWTFGLWLSTSFTTNYDEETVSSFIQGMIDRDIPLSVFHFDCYWMKEFHWCDFEWDERVFPDVKGMLARYHEKGLKICVWINPYIAQDTDFFREGVKGGYLLKRADGKGVKQVDTWQAGMGIVDFTNPEAKKWYLGKLKEVLDAGVDCFKTDFGERIPVDVVYHDGSDPVTMHNFYTYLYNEAVYGLLKEVKGEKEAVLFARSATAGSQQFPVHWGGDCSANYPSMAETLRGGLSFAMSGFSFWSHDISGFEHTAAPDLYKRWAVFGLLSSHSRLHGSTSYRVPWAFDEESCDVVRFFTKLKCSLMPYIYSMAVKAHEDGIPVMRPMVFEYMNDPACSYLDMQYMLGDSILVAPVFNEKGKVSFYLPDGKWTHLLTEEKREGGRFYTDTYDYFSLGLFAAPGSVIARGREDSRPDYDYEKDVILHVYELKDGCSAYCFIVNKAGEKVSDITVTRDGDMLDLKSSHPMDGYALCAHIEGYDDKEHAVSGMEASINIR